LRLGIVTNGATAVQNAALDALGVRPAVDAVLISEAEGVRKPDPAIFHRAAERLGVRPNECCFVGDHPIVDISGAEAAGLRAVWKRTPYWVPAAPVPTIDTISELLTLRLRA
jgi:putative hydrolase of the HAD superfamily